MSYYLLSTEVDCDACISEFAANGGCKCMNAGNDCDVSALIPEGCYNCGDEATEFCESVSGKRM